MIIALLLLIQSLKEKKRREKEASNYLKSDNPLFKQIVSERENAEKALFDFIDKHDFPISSLCDSYWKLALDDQLSCSESWQYYLDDEKEQEIIDRFLDNDEVWETIDNALMTIAGEVLGGN